MQKYDIKASKATIAIPLFNDRHYCTIKALLDRAPELSQEKYQIKKYIEQALELLAAQPDLALELSSNDIIARILIYFIGKEFRDDNK